MEERRYLITYENNGYSCYAWIDSEEELHDFANTLKNNDYIIIEVLEILSSKEIEL